MAAIFRLTGKLVILLCLALSCRPAAAADPYNDGQLRFLFSGSEVFANGGSCRDLAFNSYAYEPDFTFKFHADGILDYKIHCDTTPFPWSESGTGKWRIESGRLCIDIDNDKFDLVVQAPDHCWAIIEGEIGFEALDRSGQQSWRVSVEHAVIRDRRTLLSKVADARTEAPTPKAQAKAQATPSPSPAAAKPAAPAPVEPLPAPKTTPPTTHKTGAAAEAKFWRYIQHSRNIGDFMDYLEAYPNGMFVTLAERQIRYLVAEQAKPAGPVESAAKPEGIRFGRYHALVIGINAYIHLPQLETAVNDARAVARLLEEEYGFRVRLLIDPRRGDVIDVLDEYLGTLTKDDNLLIYYAGHGWLDEATDRGYWLPVDARPGRRSNWLSNATITDTLKSLAAKHVMVVADSCYSGTLTRSASIGIRDHDYLRRIAAKRARVAMVSGGLEPVADDSGSGFSPFAAAFMSALRANDSTIDGTRLFSGLRRSVVMTAQQTPEYSDVRNSGHEGGDFLFVRRR